MKAHEISHLDDLIQRLREQSRPALKNVQGF
jgi:hypothetical protein